MHYFGTPTAMKTVLMFDVFSMSESFASASLNAWINLLQPLNSVLVEDRLMESLKLKTKLILIYQSQKRVLLKKKKN